MKIHGGFYPAQRYSGINIKLGFSSTDETSFCRDNAIKDNKLNHTTNFFRENFSDVFSETLTEKFPEGVKIYDYACSDGSEAYSLAMSLMQTGEEKSQKYFPIIARDIGKSVIDRANSGKIEIKPEDQKKIKSKLSPAKYNTLFKPTGLRTLFTVQDKLKNCVKFEQANIARDVKDFDFSPDGKPSIIIFRNAFYHLKPEVKKNFMENLYENPGFPAGSIIYFAVPQDWTPVGLEIPQGKFAQLNEKFDEIPLRQQKITGGGAYYIYKKL